MITAQMSNLKRQRPKRLVVSSHVTLADIGLFFYPRSLILTLIDSKEYLVDSQAKRSWEDTLDKEQSSNQGIFAEPKERKRTMLFLQAILRKRLLKGTHIFLKC